MTNEEIIVCSCNCSSPTCCDPAPRNVFEDFFGSNAIIATVSTRSNLIVEYNFCAYGASQRKCMDDFESMGYMTALPTVHTRQTCEKERECCCCIVSTSKGAAPQKVVSEWNGPGQHEKKHVEKKICLVGQSGLAPVRRPSIPGVRRIRWGSWGDLVLDFEI